MRDLSRGIASALLMGSAAPALVAAASFPPAGVRLERLTRKDMEEARAVGVGCYWSLPGERGVRFAAADDRAAIKVDGKVVGLRPAHGAKDVFPFTFDSWQGNGVAVSVRSVGRAERGGPESVKRLTILSIRMGDVVVERRGTLDCGS